MSSLTQIALEPWDPAIDRLVQACQQHPKRDHIWFSKQPCSSKFSFGNGEQSTVKERLVIYFRNVFFPSNAVWLPPGRSTCFQACCILD